MKTDHVRALSVILRETAEEEGMGENQEIKRLLNNLELIIISFFFFKVQTVYPVFFLSTFNKEMVIRENQDEFS